MIEIVFSESAKGSLKVAKAFNGRKPATTVIGVILGEADTPAKAATEKEIEAAKAEARKRHRLAWEKAVPIEGNPGDVFSFSPCLSYGDISNADLDSRIDVLTQLLSVWYPAEAREQAVAQIAKDKEEFDAVMKRAIDDSEPMRLWYSNNPDELCGLYWFLYQLHQQEECNGAVYLVKLPELEYRENGTMVKHMGWGEVAPEEFSRYIYLARPMLPVFENACAADWRQLMQENAPLRAVLNGRLRSMPVDLYDTFIEQEIERMPDEFNESILIGNVLGRHQLCIGDCLIALRIEEMIRDGKLAVITQPAEGDPLYRRILKKGTHHV